MADFVSGLKIGVKLGNGAFGEVFRGEDPAHGEVAVKILRRETYHDDATWPATSGIPSKGVVGSRFDPSARPWAMAGVCVRREKAALSSGCKSHPANAPAGSNRSSHGGDEMAEAFGVAGHI